MSEKPEDFCTDCPGTSKRSRRWIGKTAVGGFLAAAMYKLTGGTVLPEQHEWRPATVKHAEEWIDRRGPDILKDEDAPEEMKDAIRERNTDYVINTLHLEINHAPRQAAGATITCTAVTQWCSYSNCSPQGKCIREYYCCGYSYGCTYTDKVFACPSCPCPMMR